MIDLRCACSHGQAPHPNLACSDPDCLCLTFEPDNLSREIVRLRIALGHLLIVCRDGAVNGFNAEAFAIAMDDAAMVLGKAGP